MRLAYLVNAPAIRARREREAALASGRRPTPGEVLAWGRAEGLGEGEAQRQASEYMLECMRADAQAGG